MARKSRYERYDPRVKAAIAATGRIDLFPQLKIPEMTARYWIGQKFEFDDPVLAGLADTIADAKYEIECQKKKLAERDALMKLHRDASSILGHGLSWKQIDSREIKSRILNVAAAAMKIVSREECLNELGLSLSRYKRWRRERKKCGITGTKSCPRFTANQLTYKEVQIMRDLVTSKEFSHYPIRSLHYYAKREGLLFSAYSTWLKYIAEFKWVRPRKVHRARKYEIGIRAKFPNEIWHLDVSYFILPDRTKLFIQAIVDNFSRYVVAWQVLDSYDGSKTGELLRRAISKAHGFNEADKKLRLIVDGGGENKGQAMDGLERAGHFRKEVARFEISFSNSMIETVFRSMKHNYLFHEEITCLASLKRHADFWFTEHNEEIPHTAFKGETPLEVYQHSWTKESQIRIIVRQKEAVKMRIQENQKIFCERCINDMA